jgi:hypothetical protein
MAAVGAPATAGAAVAGGGAAYYAAPSLSHFFLFFSVFLVRFTYVYIL